jgi:excisionase family DNA binding protein
LRVRRFMIGGRGFKGTVEVAELLHRHPSTIYRLNKQRQISVLKLAKDYRFARADVLNWIAGLEGNESHSRGRRTRKRRSGI